MTAFFAYRTPDSWKLSDLEGSQAAAGRPRMGWFSSLERRESAEAVETDQSVGLGPQRDGRLQRIVLAQLTVFHA